MVAMLLLLDLNVANDMKYKSYSTNLQFVCLFFFQFPLAAKTEIDRSEQIDMGKLA